MWFEQHTWCLDDENRGRGVGGWVVVSIDHTSVTWQCVWCNQSDNGRCEQLSLESLKVSVCAHFVLVYRARPFSRRALTPPTSGVARKGSSSIDWFCLCVCMYIHKLTIATYSTYRKLLIFLLCKIQSYSSGWQWSFITMVTNKQPLLYLPLLQCLLFPLPPSGRVMAVQWDGAATATGGEWIREWTEVGTGVSEKLFARWRRECVLVCTVGSAVGCWHRAEGIQFTPR